jgi:hypothetical protein
VEPFFGVEERLESPKNYKKIKKKENKKKRNENIKFIKKLMKDLHTWFQKEAIASVNRKGQMPQVYQVVKLALF